MININPKTTKSEIKILENLYLSQNEDHLGSLGYSPAQSQITFYCSLITAAMSAKNPCRCTIALGKIITSSWLITKLIHELCLNFISIGRWETHFLKCCIHDKKLAPKLGFHCHFAHVWSLVNGAQSFQESIESKPTSLCKILFGLVQVCCSYSRIINFRWPLHSISDGRKGRWRNGKLPSIHFL